MAPSLSGNNPARQFSAVDLPQPEGPRSATNSPPEICRSSASPLDPTATCAALTHWQPLRVPNLKAFGTVPSTRGLMSQPVVDATMSTVPWPRFFMFSVVPDG